MDGTESSTKQTKNKVKRLFNFFIFIPTHPNGPNIGSSGTPPSSLFYSRPSSESSGRLLSM